ncbi:hypothetical protein MCOR25_004550 [Pyricularia grisea]|uniref:Life-span regulatory factor domain-containing protein n=1 Tax=Pyricularia grisea TaxID=148305 RepID=A0A6P8B7I9_PYRGI|nr:hypothetical protein PgNI_05690 [Pyricularia grisea]KAI6368807.1 hypothetical protein MCOR25_004550 [Pyricularia grisea]TLD11208.1 hypothetical protein PgNI_05690 [Pyricularia grisea]
MAFEIQWDHQFCLACDRQTDGATYCSESCRLADYEKTSPSSSTPNSGASSPALAGPSYAWGFSNMTSSTSSLYQSHGFDSSASPLYQSYQQRSANPAPGQTLSPSSSHASLSSMGSNAAKNNEAYQLSEKARRELQAYASSFEQVRLQRRRSQ